jgi:uncharacterized membrane protein
MEFEASRILSAVGAVLLAAGSFISGLGIVGVILLLVGLKGLADAYRDESIFKNAIYALIFEVAANGAFIFILFGAVFNALRRWVLGGGGFLALLSGFGLALAAATILLTVGAYFYRKSFIALSARSREHPLRGVWAAAPRRRHPNDNFNRPVCDVGRVDGCRRRLLHH